MVSPVCKAVRAGSRHVSGWPEVVMHGIFREKMLIVIFFRKMMFMGIFFAVLGK